MEPHLLFAGRIGSGKTQVSKRVANELGHSWNSFGSTLRRIAIERGMPTTREALQALGETMVCAGAEGLCRRVLVEAQPPAAHAVVIDGVRHQHIRDILQVLVAPQPVLLIYVHVRDEVRKARIANRDGLTDAQVERFEEHSTEAQALGELQRAADMVVDNSGQIDATAAAILEFVQHERE